MQPAAPQIPDHYQAPYSPNDLAPPPESPQLEGTPSRLPPHPEARPGSSSAPEVRREVKQDDFDRQGPRILSAKLNLTDFARYLTTVHPYLPLLDERKEMLEVQLTQCPKPLQDAFLDTLSATASSFPADPSQPASRAIDQAYRNLVEWELLHSPASSAERRAADLTYIQTLLLMAIEADNRPPSIGGPPKEAILGRAVSGAMSRRLHQFWPKNQAASSLAPEAGDNIPLRVWWVLVVLDRWHAVSTGCHALIPKRHINAPPGLRKHLGEGFYYLLRASPPR